MRRLRRFSPVLSMPHWNFTIFLRPASARSIIVTSSLFAEMPSTSCMANIYRSFFCFEETHRVSHALAPLLVLVPHYLRIQLSMFIGRMAVRIKQSRVLVNPKSTQIRGTATNPFYVLYETDKEMTVLRISILKILFFCYPIVPLRLRFKS